MWQTVAGCRGGKQVQIQNPLALKYQLAKIGLGSAAGAAALRFVKYVYVYYTSTWVLVAGRQSFQL